MLSPATYTPTSAFGRSPPTEAKTRCLIDTFILHACAAVTSDLTNAQPLNVQCERGYSFGPVKLNGKRVIFFGRMDYSIWYGETELLCLNGLVVEAKGGPKLPQLLGYIIYGVYSPGSGGSTRIVVAIKWTLNRQSRKVSDAIVPETTHFDVHHYNGNHIDIRNEQYAKIDGTVSVEESDKPDELPKYYLRTDCIAVCPNPYKLPET
ncbi:hypothetical protein N7535_007541 [Penicillium sp. DV-2018c]|nr:hypothetical protein N7461_003566 [Penicillium sp. DV-2018c]KAJ5565903.1 hypothetical protein N7535_007541 [Penicillium sp. DV-2018c]